MTATRKRSSDLERIPSFNPLILILGLFLLGCATGDQRSPIMALNPANFGIEKRHALNVSLELRGTRAPGLFVFGINEAEFRKTVTKLIEGSRVFRRIVAREKADFHLSITVFRAQGGDHPFKDIPGNTELGWTLRDAKTNQIVWQEAIETEYLHIGVQSKTSFAGAVVKPTSQAFAENLQIGIEKLSRLTLKRTIDA